MQSARLPGTGNLKDGVNDVKKAKWFHGMPGSNDQMRWQMLLDKEVQAAYKPTAKSSTDTSRRA